MNYNELSKQAHKNAVNHGFCDKIVSNEHSIMMIISEVAEMVEADRKEKRYNPEFVKGKTSEEAFKRFVKDTVEDEMADVVIRLLSLSGKLAINFDKVRPCSYTRAFKNFTFAENAYGLTKGLVRDTIAIERRIPFALHYISEWAKHMHIDLDFHVTIKMRYNAGRPRLHGKNY